MIKFGEYSKYVSIFSFVLCSAISADELTVIRDNLPEELKGEVEKIFQKRLEFEFHSAGYHVMLETTTGLRTAAGHLVKVHYEKRYMCTYKKTVTELNTLSGY